MSTAPPNSAKPTTAEIVGGSYNLTPPVLVDGQAASLQLDVNGNLKTTSSGGGGGGNVNITGINGPAPALSNPLPVELSDGTNAFGTAGNPISVNVISGGGSNASVGLTNATAPTSATEIGIIDNGGKLQGVSASNPVPISAASLPLPALAATSTLQTSGGQKTQIVDGSGNVIGSTANALNVNISSPNPLPISGTVSITGTIITQDAADGTVGLTAPAIAVQTGAVNSLGKLTATQSDANGNLLVGFNGTLMTVFQEILSEIRSLRRLHYLVYEESGEGNPTQSLLDDPSDPTQVDYQ